LAVIILVFFFGGSFVSGSHFAEHVKNREAAQKTFLNRVKDATGLEAQTLSEERAQGLVYECVKCGAKVVSHELELRGGGIKCTICGYRVLKKIRPPVVKRVTAE